MANKEFIVLVSNKEIAFNPSFSVSTRMTNLLIPLAMRFSESKETYWKVTQTNYGANSSTLTIKVTDYYPKDISGFSTNPMPKRPINSIVFEPFNWQLLKGCLSFYHKKLLINYLYNTEDPEYNDPTTKSWTIAYKTREPGDSQKKISTFKYDFWMPFSEIKFDNGKVIFEKTIIIHSINEVVHFEIFNDHLRQEFENIKEWFFKKLGTTKFKVEGVFTREGIKLVKVEATSKSIDKIDKEFIEKIKLKTISDNILGAKESINGKSILDLREIDKNVVVDSLFLGSEENLLDYIFKNKGARNYLQLTYLAKEKHSINNAIKYTLLPNFGFLFHIEGSNEKHVVWELLNSHATYIWSFYKKKLDTDIYEELEKTISYINKDGRNNYKDLWRSKEIDGDKKFSFILHKTGNDNFESWRQNLVNVTMA